MAARLVRPPRLISFQCRISRVSVSRMTSVSPPLPAAIAPYQVVVTITNIAEAPLLAAGEQVAADLTAAGLDVLLDDRDERAGVKFKDADLTGVPYRVNIGRGVAEGKVEIVDRLENKNHDVALTDAVQHLTGLIQAHYEVSTKN